MRDKATGGQSYRGDKAAGETMLWGDKAMGRGSKLRGANRGHLAQAAYTARCLPERDFAQSVVAESPCSLRSNLQN